jgi:hypothetical protein
LKNIFIKIIALLSLVPAVYAQSDSAFPVKTYLFDIVYDTTNKKIDSSNIHKPVCSNPTTIHKVNKILSLEDTNLEIKKSSKSVMINVNNITSIKFYEGNKFLLGMIGGAIMGFTSVMGIYDKSVEEDPSNSKYFGEALKIGLIVAVPFAIIGAIYGLSVDDTHDYNLANLTPEKKTIKLIKLFRKYKSNSK